MSAIAQTAKNGFPTLPSLAGDTQENTVIALSLFISPQLNETLNELAAKTGGSKVDVFRKALALFELAVDARDQGKKFGIAEKDQSLTTEVVGI